MKNLQVSLPLVDGGLLPVSVDSGREFIHRLAGDDFGPPPVRLILKARTDEGRTVTISIPYDDDGAAYAAIEGK
jgi:hypothetical protein